MSTFFVAAIIIGLVVAICLLLIRSHNKHKRDAMNNILKHFSQLGAENNLRFSSQEVLTNCVLGLDGVNGKILVATREDGFYGSFIIDLNEVKNCSLKKIYRTIKVGDWTDHKLDEYLEKMVLRFEFSHKPSVEIVFYNNHDNHIYEMQELEKKAKHWEEILTKMPKPMRQIA